MLIHAIAITKSPVKKKNIYKKFFIISVLHLHHILVEKKINTNMKISIVLAMPQIDERLERKC